MLSQGNLDDLAAFAAVARALSFTRAVAELRLSTSALSHTIKGLEARLGLRLLHWKTERYFPISFMAKCRRL